MESRPSRSRVRSWILAAAGVLVLMAPAYGVSAPEIRIEPATVYFGAAGPGAAVGGGAEEALPSSRPRVSETLREKAVREGSVRILVRLAAAFTPEGYLEGARAAGQRQSIGRVQDAALRKLEGARVAVHGRYERIPFLALEVDGAALDLVARLPEVVAIEEDELQRPLLASSNASIGSGVAWASGLTGAGQVIAVLDTGVDKTHPYFSSGGHNKVVSEACYSTAGSVFGNLYTSLCPGGATESTAPGSGLNCNTSMSSDCQHGTHVAGIAAGNDGVGPNFGVARDADLIAIQVFSAACNGFCIGSFTSDQIKGLERIYALADQFDIAAVNVSIGGNSYFSQAECDSSNAAYKAAVDNLRSIDIATVAAAGSGFYATAPACLSSAISVGASDDAGALFPFSAAPPYLSLLAPGASITSSVPGGGTATMDGTSMAAPHVAGAWAVLKQAHPSATVSDVLALLRGTATRVGVNGYDLWRLNLGRAVLGGPFVTQEFRIHNDGTAVLSVLSMQLETLVPGIRWSPEAPFDVLPGGSREVSVSVDFGAMAAGTSLNRLIVSSTDADENPYPNAVHLVIGKDACYPLTRTRAGNGGYPAASPASSPGCQPGEYRAGETIQLTSLPATGWALQSWSGTDNDSSTAATNTLTMPAAPRTVSVTYYAPCFALTLAHTGSGANPLASPASSTGCPAGQYHYAEPIQLTAAPGTGWRVGGWTNTSRDTSIARTNSLLMAPGPLTVSVTYLEGLASVVLVDNDPSGFDYRSVYTDALDALGVIYDVWDIAQDGRPSLADLAEYPRVVWYAYRYSAALEAADEALLASYLDHGGRLFFTAQDYLDYRGLTPFAATYLGVGSFQTDLGPAIAQGQGSAFSGLGPFDLDYPAYYDGDGVSPAAGAEVAFSAVDGDGIGLGPVGVSKIGPDYRTIFLGFQFESLFTPANRRDVMGAALDFISTVFVDVPPGYWAKRSIEAIYRNGVTAGCSLNPRLYCPGGQVTRNQMAFFLLRAKEGNGYTPPPCVTQPFNDVPVSDSFCPWIQELVLRGVTAGCGNGNYCPATPVTREQMAFFLLKTLEGPAYAPPPCTDPFKDVSPGSFFCPWIQELAHRGLTGGCGGGNYCPFDPVNRAQMATFLVTSFGVPLL